MTEPTNPTPDQPSQTPPTNPAGPGPAASGTPGATPPAQPTPEGFEQADIDQNKVFALLAYIGILWLVPLLAAPKSKFAKFHTNQGLNLFLVSFGAAIALGIVAFFPFVGWIVSCLGYPVLMIGIFAMMIMGIINAANGKAKKLPVIGDLFTLIK